MNRSWNRAKGPLTKLFIDNKATMKSSVLAILRSIQKQSDLIRSFFQMEFTPINQGDTVQIVAVEGLTAKVIPRT